MMSYMTGNYLWSRHHWIELLCGSIRFRYLRTIRSFHSTHTTFNHIQPLGRHIRRPRSDLDLICPSSRHSDGHRQSQEGMTTLNFHPPYGSITWQLGSLQVCCSSSILNLSLASGLLIRDTQVLYTDFSASRQRRLLAFPRCVQAATPIPNSDSAATLNRRFYYSPDPHAAFDCDSKCTTP